MEPWMIAVAVFLALFIGWKLRLAYRSPAELRRISDALAGGGVLVDVRTSFEFANGHLPQAINLPLGFSPESADGLGAKDSPVVVYCASGTRSAHAAKILRRAGFQSVLDLGPMHNGRKLSSAPAEP